MIKSVSVYVDGNMPVIPTISEFSRQKMRPKNGCKNLTHMDAPSNMICSVGNPARLARVRHDRAQPRRATLTLSS
jgi:hypothetical protein